MFGQHDRQISVLSRLVFHLFCASQLTHLILQYRDIIKDLQEAVDAKIKKKDTAKKDWKKTHYPRVAGGDCVLTHLPRHPTLKTAHWAIDADWCRWSLSEGDRCVEQDYVTGESADDEESEGEGDDQR